MLDAIGIVVTDMARSTAFYRRLGLDFPETTADDHVEATATGGFRVMLDTEALVVGFNPSFEPPAGPGRVVLAFRCDSPEEVDRLYAELTATGATDAPHLDPFDAFWGQRYATLADPDGNLVDLFAPLDMESRP